MEKKIAAKKLPPPCQTRESPPLNRWNRWKAQELCEGRRACRCGEINLPARRTSRYGRAFFRQCAQRSANIDPSIYHPMRWTAARFHPDRSTRSIDRSIAPCWSEWRRGETRREGHDAAAAQFAGSLGAPCVLSHPTTTGREGGGGGGLGEEERARKKSVVNWDQDVTPRARGRIGTWSGSYTYPTGTGTGALCGSRTRARARAHTRAHGDPRYVSAAATGNNKRRAILINYLYR